MNSAQRRKFRRRWRYRIGYNDLKKSFDAYRIFDMADWCDRKWGAKNWKLSSKDGFYFLFDRKDRLLLFIIKWSE